MQDLKKNTTKYFGYLIILFIGYLLGDSQIVKDVYSKLHVNVGSVENNEIQKNISLNKIYFIGEYIVKKIVDGDTFYAESKNGDSKIVRMMAVNTLEKNDFDVNKKCFAKQQTELTSQLLLNKQVFLYGDETQPKLDKYSRLLAYVATTTQEASSLSDLYFYNHFLVESGFADVYKATPKAILYDRFLEKKNLAEKNRLGMWSGVCK